MATDGVLSLPDTFRFYGRSCGCQDHIHSMPAYWQAFLDQYEITRADIADHLQFKDVVEQLKFCLERWFSGADRAVASTRSVFPTCPYLNVDLEMLAAKLCSALRSLMAVHTPTPRSDSPWSSGSYRMASSSRSGSSASLARSGMTPAALPETPLPSNPNTRSGRRVPFSSSVSPAALRESAGRPDADDPGATSVVSLQGDRAEDSEGEDVSASSRDSEGAIPRSSVSSLLRSPSDMEVDDGAPPAATGEVCAIGVLLKNSCGTSTVGVQHVPQAVCTCVCGVVVSVCGVLVV